MGLSRSGKDLSNQGSSPVDEQSKRPQWVRNSVSSMCCPNHPGFICHTGCFLEDCGLFLVTWSSTGVSCASGQKPSEIKYGPSECRSDPATSLTPIHCWCQFPSLCIHLYSPSILKTFLILMWGENWNYFNRKWAPVLRFPSPSHFCVAAAVARLSLLLW